MGFYLRKSFRAGPIRFNFSRSGIGASVGVTGARIGIPSSGRAYVHGGRGGLYYRKSLGGDVSRGSRKAGGAQAGGASSGWNGPIELTEETGVTYGAPGRPKEEAAAPTAAPVRRLPRTYGWLALGAIAVGLLLPAPFHALVAAGVLTALILLTIRRRMRRAAGDAYGRLLAAQVTATERIGNGVRSAVDVARRDRWLTPDDARYFEERAYLAALEAATPNGADDTRAFERIAELEGLVDFDPAFRRRARLDAYVRAHVEAVSDHELTEGEERALKRARAAFELTDDELADELSLLERLRELRGIRDGDLPVVAPAAKLPGREKCHLESEGRLLKKRLLRSFSRDGQRYKVRGFVTDKEGTLVVTNKRVALIHLGVTSIPIGRILDIEVDHDRQLLVLIRDGVATPTYVTTPDALRAGAIVAALADRR